jgi:hypothetical protein
MRVDDDEIFSGTFVDEDLLLLLESYICSTAFQRRFSLLSKSYSIPIMSSTSALKALDKALDAWASRHMHLSLRAILQGMRKTYIYHPPNLRIHFT